MGKTQKRAARKKAALHTHAEPVQKKSLKQAVKKAGERITAAFKRSDWQDALAALQAMQSAGLTPTAVLCNKVITALGQAHQLDQAKQLLLQMRGRGDAQGPCAGVRPTSVTYAAMIKFLGRAGDVDAALALLDAMGDDGVAPDATCWNSAITACAGQAEAWPRALGLLRRAVAAHQADVVSYNAALSVLHKAGRAAEAARVCADLCAPGNSVRPNEITFTTTIAAHAAASDSAAALRLLRSMPEHGVSATTAACNAAIAACERAGKWQDALELLRDMEASGPPPDAVTVRSAIFACCSASPGPPRVAEAKAIFKRVEAGDFPGVPRTAVTYNVLVRACGVDFVGSHAAQLGLLEGFLRPDGASESSSETVMGPGGLEAVQESPQTAAVEQSVWRPEPFHWPPALEQAAACSCEADVDALRRGIRVIAREKGCQRRPPNKYDLTVWAAEAQLLAQTRADARPPVVRQEVPGVSGAFLLSGVFTPAECRRIVAIAEAMGFAPDEPLKRGAGVIGGSGEARIDGCVWLADEAIAGPVYDRIRSSLDQDVQGCAPAGINCRWRLFRYGQEAVYRPHVDGSWPGSGVRDGALKFDAFGDRWSRFTFLAYLNDDFEGGCTTFFTCGKSGQGLQARCVAPQTGAVLVFPHGIDNPLSPVHEGSKVCRGTKYVIRSDILYYKQRSESASDAALASS